MQHKRTNTYQEEKGLYVDTPQELTHISLCAGYGGIDLGLKRALGSVRTIAFSEIEAFAVSNLVSKMEAGVIEPAPVWSNLKTFPWEEFCGKVDILSGGFPCQPFSCTGTKSGDNDPRHLWPDIIRGIEVCRPALLFLENVEGIIGSTLKQDWGVDIKGTPVLLHILRELERREYSPTWGIFSAVEVGAPHHRKRVFIFAQANELLQSGIDHISKLLEQNRDFGGTPYFGALSNVWSRSRGKLQYSWEPRRVLSKERVKMGNSIGPDGSSPEYGSEQPRSEDYGSRAESTQPDRSGVAVGEHGRGDGVEPSMGRDVDGITDWVGVSKLYESFTSTEDELRLLGNGVVPRTAELAFKTLWGQVNK